MIVIGERINGMFKSIRKAIQEQDKEVIQRTALRQIEGGADFLDVNVGPASADPKATMLWLIEAIQEVTDKTICIDTPKYEVMEAAVKACRNPICINSSKGTDEDLGRLLPLAKEHNASIICLTMDERGLPQDVNHRVEVAAKILAMAMDLGIEMDKIFLDPIIFPINVAQQQAGYVLESIKQFTMLNQPSPHIVVGLSNISQGAKLRSLINRTFVVMGIQNGLDAAIVDANDEELMNAIITAELVMNKQIYSDSYIKAYLASKG